MQALEREITPMTLTHVERQDHSYERHGTQCLIANFEMWQRVKFYRRQYKKLARKRILKNISKKRLIQARKLNGSL